jgi:thiaminase
MTFDTLLNRHPAVWHQATTHPFLDGVHDGTLPRDAFDRWLAQDYLFVRAALDAQSLLLSTAPRSDHSLLIGGLVALEEELTWFETHLQARGLNLQARLLPANRAYGDYVRVTAREDYPAGIMMTAALERAYLQAWSGARPGAEQFREFVEHWTTDGFRAYVDALVQAADRAFTAGTQEQQREAEDAFLWTAHYEREFWQMAFG